MVYRSSFRFLRPVNERPHASLLVKPTILALAPSSAAPPLGQAIRRSPACSCRRMASRSASSGMSSLRFHGPLELDERERIVMALGVSDYVARRRLIVTKASVGKPLNQYLLGDVDAHVRRPFVFAFGFPFRVVLQERFERAYRLPEVAVR